MLRIWFFLFYWINTNLNVFVISIVSESKDLKTISSQKHAKNCLHFAPYIMLHNFLFWCLIMTKLFLDLSIPVLLMLKHKLCCLPFDIRLTAFKEIFISLGRNLIIFQKKIVYFWLNRFLRHISFVENFVIFLLKIKCPKTKKKIR